jgi:hypothetical protein
MSELLDTRSPPNSWTYLNNSSREIPRISHFSLYSIVVTPQPQEGTKPVRPHRERLFQAPRDE